MPLISVITPFSRGIKELSQLIRDFRNQVFTDFEHIIVRDGIVPEDIKQFMKEHEKDYNIKFTSVDKDTGNMSISPGTKPRNQGLFMSQGKYVVFADDDDRYCYTYLSYLIDEMKGDMITAVQMACPETRTVQKGNPNRVAIIPELGLSFFPVICHVGTPCCLIPRKWAIADPWRHEPQHDYRFFKRIVDKYKPPVLIKPGIQVDVGGLLLLDEKDWTHQIEIKEIEEEKCPQSQ